MKIHISANTSTCISARSTDKEILQKAQDGGIATALMTFALEQGIIDGTIVAVEGDRPWEQKPFVAMSREDILKARGTKYSVEPRSPGSRGYPVLGLDKVGVTGVCCQMQAVRKAQLYPINMRDVPGKVALTVGLFCMENFQLVPADHRRGPRQSEPQLREEDGNREGQVLGLYRARERFHPAAKGDPQVRTTRLPRLPRLCLQPRRHLNRARSVAQTAGSEVFIRTKKGNEVWSKAVAAGMFETKPIEEVKPGLELVTKLSKEKIDKNRKTVEERKTFGVNKALRDPYA